MRLWRWVSWSLGSWANYRWIGKGENYYCYFLWRGGRCDGSRDRCPFCTLIRLLGCWWCWWHTRKSCLLFETICIPATRTVWRVRMSVHRECRWRLYGPLWPRFSVSPHPDSLHSAEDQVDLWNLFVADICKCRPIAIPGFSALRDFITCWKIFPISRNRCEGSSWLLSVNIKSKYLYDGYLRPSKLILFSFLRPLHSFFLFTAGMSWAWW